MSRCGPPRIRLPWLVACVVAAACQGAAPPAPGPPGAPLAFAFFRDPVIDRLALSPDGEWIAGIVRPEGVPVLFEKKVRGDQTRALGKLGGRDVVVRTVGWSGGTKLVVGFEVPGERSRGDERTIRMLAVTTDHSRWGDPSRERRVRTLSDQQSTERSWRLPVHPSTRQWVLHWLPDDPERILVSRWESDDEGASVRSARVDDGIQSEVLPPRPFVRQWFADFAAVVRAGRGWDPETTSEIVYARRSARDPFEPLIGRDVLHDGALDFAGFDLDPRRLYVYAPSEADRRALFEYDLERRERTRVVHADPDYDVGALLHSPVDGRLWAVEVHRERPTLHFVDADAQREHASIDATFPNTINRIVSASRDGGTAIVLASADTRPPEYFVYDRVKREMAVQPAPYPELRDVALAPMQPLRFAARDGVEIPAYLSVPPGAEARGLPAIVLVHDGPTERVHWGYDPAVQYLVSRGFAVLQPNFRGSSGYGHAFERLGHREWGGAMQRDLADAARWLVAEGIADPERIGIYGRGYGGYAALMGVADAPELFRAAAAFGAVTDRIDLLENPGHYDSADPNHPLVGVTPRDRAQLAATSPVQRAAGIRAPVLLAHGSRDPVVHVSQMRRMRDALEAAGVEVETHLYRDETHELVVEAHRIEFHEALARFFDRHLQARVPL